MNRCKILQDIMLKYSNLWSFSEFEPFPPCYEYFNGIKSEHIMTTECFDTIYFACTSRKLPLAISLVSTVSSVDVGSQLRILKKAHRGYGNRFYSWVILLLFQPLRSFSFSGRQCCYELSLSNTTNLHSDFFRETSRLLNFTAKSRRKEINGRNPSNKIVLQELLIGTETFYG